MRFNIYTSIIQLKNYSIFFESFSGRFIVANKVEIDKDKEGVESLYKNNCSLYAQLLQHEFIVDDDFCEVDRLRNRIYSLDNRDDVFILNLNPTMDCNFHCWYCYESHNENSEMSCEVQSSVIQFVENLISDNNKLKKLCVGFFGGEPLLKADSIVKSLIDRISHICELNNVELNIGFTTNGYLLNDEFINYILNFKSYFQITLDGGRANHNKTRFSKYGENSYDKILGNVVKLISKRIFVMLRINFTRQNISSINEIFDDLLFLSQDERNFLTIDFQRVWQERDSKDDDVDDLAQQLRQSFIKNGFKVSSNYISNVNDTCYGNCRHHVLINYNGEVFGCTARDFVTNNRIGFIDSNGVIHYDYNKRESRLKSRFSKKICWTCRIAPYCGGGCAQRAYESGNTNECIYGYSDTDIDNLILKLFEQTYC